MRTVHAEVYKLMKDTYPDLNIGDCISYDDTYGTFLDVNGNRVDQKYVKLNPTNILGGITPSAFVEEGEEINDAIERALSYTSLKAVKGLDYNVVGNVAFKSNLELKITVNFSVNSPVYTGSFIVRFYNQERSGFNSITPRDLTGTYTFSQVERIQAFALAHVFISDVATLQNGYMSTTWIDDLIIELTKAGISTEGVRDQLVGTIAYKIYSDTYSDLIDIPFFDGQLTLRYQGSRVTPPLLTYVEIPVI